MRKIILVLIVCALLSLGLLPAQAQADATIIAYGETLTGELSNESYEVRYEFKGEAGDFVRVNIKPTDILNDLDNPAIIVETSSGVPLVTNDFFGLGGNVFLQLPDSGIYYAVATRTDGAAGESVGEYALTLEKLSVIEENFSDAALQVGVNSSLYYLIKPESNFTVSFANAEGDLDTQFTLNSINEEDGRLLSVAMMGGSQVFGGSISVKPALYYVLAIERAPFALSATAGLTFDLDITFEE